MMQYDNVSARDTNKYFNSYNTPNLCLNNPELQNYDHKKHQQLEQPWTAKLRTSKTCLWPATTRACSVACSCRAHVRNRWNRPVSSFREIMLIAALQVLRGNHNGTEVVALSCRPVSVSMALIGRRRWDRHDKNEFNANKLLLRYRVAVVFKIHKTLLGIT